MKGEPVYRYLVDDIDFALIDQDGPVIILDLSTNNWFQIVWETETKQGKAWLPECSCSELIADEVTGNVTQRCIHYRVWLKYFYDEICEDAY